MRIFHPFPVDDITLFKHQLLSLSESFAHFCYLDSNNYPDYPYSTFGSFFAFGALEVLSVRSECLEQFDAFREKNNDWVFGFLSYDLKNEIEPGLYSNHPDIIGMPNLHFFVPEYLVKIENDSVEVGLRETDDAASTLLAFRKKIEQVATAAIPKSSANAPAKLRARISKEDYIRSVERIKAHIRRGDVYELNFCQEFYDDAISIHPVNVFKKLNRLSRAPFSCFFKANEHYLLCASPERFLKRQYNKLISQPIKGTRRRSGDHAYDTELQEELRNDDKEKSENIMIVDLVRNDLSRIAIRNSVKVEELFGIYSFEQVHQMISTISCSIPPAIHFTDIIRQLFPMGSMTGAPKIAAMELIERYETSRRGLFSGAVGYITPRGNFDLNVVIRSILYNAATSKLSVQAGSALTIDCDAEKEYEECLLKAKAMFEALS